MQFLYHSCFLKYFARKLPEEAGSILIDLGRRVAKAQEFSELNVPLHFWSFVSFDGLLKMLVRTQI